MAVFSALGTAVAGALSFGTFATAVTVSGFQLIGGLGISLLAQSLAGKGPERPGFSVSGKLQAGGDVPRSFLVGLAVTAGSLVYANTWGASGKTPNAYLTQVIALSDLPATALREVWVNGEKGTLGSTPSSLGRPVLEYRSAGRDHLWVHFYDGTQAIAPSMLTGSVSSSERPYDSGRVGRGVAYAVVTARINQELFTGFPSFKFACDGAKFYDPSRDSTVGGSGSQRWNTPSTWGGDGDHLPAVQIYNLLRGVTYGGDWLYGLQSLPEARLPAASWISQITRCRALIAGPGGNEATYRAGGEVWVTAQVADTIEALATTCQGRLCEAGGFYKLHVGGPATAVSAITDDVILSSEEQSFSPFFGLAETITGVNARYPSPEEGWGTKVAPPLIDAALEAKAGNRRLMADVPLDYLPYRGQVQRVMQEALREAQRARRHTFVLPPDYWGIEPGDFISWTSPRNGYDAKQFRIDGVQDKANLDQVVDLTEVDPSDYDWDQEADYRPPTDGSLGVERPPAQVISGFGVEAATVNNDSNNPVRPAIRLYWEWDEDDADIEGVQFEVRRAATAVLQFEGRGDRPEAGQLVIASFAFTPATDYEVRARFISISKARPMEWSLWLPVSTPDVRLGPNDVYLAGMVEEIQETVREGMQFVGPGLRALLDDALRLAEQTSEQDAGNYFDKQQIREERVSTFDQLTAEFRRVVTAQTGPGSAISARLEQLRATVEDDVAEALSLLQAQVNGELGALAEAITSVSASTIVGGVASANLRMSAQAGPDGYAGRIAFEARAGGAGAFRAASLFLDVPASPSAPTRIVLDAQNLYFGDLSSGSVVNPLVFDGTFWRVSNVRVGDLVFNKLRSADGKLVISGEGGTYIEVFA